MKSTLIVAALYLCSAAPMPCAAQNDSGPQVSQRAQRLHDSAIVVDTHADTPQRFLDTNFDIGTTDPSDKGQISLDKARKGN